jgi:hypothetical protein
MDDRFDKWDKWFGGIYSEVTSLSVNRNIFWEVQDIIKNNPRIHKPSSFYEFLGSIYAVSSLMGIRRQVKIDKKSISFARLLEEICETPKVLSRSRFVSLYRGSTAEEFADRDFDRFAGGSREHVDPGLVKSDLEDLRARARKCEKYADQRVAHFDKRAHQNVLTFAEIDGCIDFLEELTKKYYLLFRGNCLLSILPTYQYDWKEIFQEPWIP